MRLTTRTTLALRTLMVCAINPDQIVRKSDVAQALSASENHLAQVVNQLGQAGYLKTLRGRRGGFTLARSPRDISVGALFRHFEAELPLTDCFEDDDACPLKGNCRMTGHLQTAIEAFYASLDPISLEDLVKDNDGLRQVLLLDQLTRDTVSTGCLLPA